ncbi:hypothetical protein LTR66_002451 [Elasticomyces elasticus]|nr:hypothetical protein LTR66_002451 [Elasticomyces elasticus]
MDAFYSTYEYYADNTRKTAMDFPTACRALLDEVFITAKLVIPENKSLVSDPHRALTVIDLGFGCGDQTVHMMQETYNTVPTDSASTAEQRFPPIKRYVGVTLDRTQFHLGMLGRSHTSSSIEIFCADAAQPASWSEELARAAKPTLVSPSSSRDASKSAKLAESINREIWVLALDTLYHFAPSRQPIFDYARRELEASLMVFDLALADDASWFDRALLAIVCLFTGTPFSNFVTAAQYRTMLISAGYDEDSIELRDVSEHIFAPLTRFLLERERQLGLIGLGIGGFRVARWMFGWWGKSGVVRGVIVIARR